MSNAFLKRAELVHGGGHDETKGAGTDRQRLKHAPVTDGGRADASGRAGHGCPIRGRTETHAPPA